MEFVLSILSKMLPLIGIINLFLRHGRMLLDCKQEQLIVIFTNCVCFGKRKNINKMLKNKLLLKHERVYFGNSCSTQISIY